MTTEDKIKARDWLKNQITKLEHCQYYVQAAFREQVDRLRIEVQHLDADIEDEEQQGLIFAESVHGSPFTVHQE